jgi:hypothetical protein
LHSGSVLKGCSSRRWLTRLPECDVFCAGPKF